MTTLADSGSTEFDELLALIPQPRVVIIDGLRVEIPELTFGALARMAAVARPMLVEAPGRPFIDAVVEHLDIVLELLSIALDQPAEWIEALPPDIAVRLLAALHEVNRDFSQALMAPRTAGPRLIAVLGGRTSSNCSSRTGTRMSRRLRIARRSSTRTLSPAMRTCGARWP